MSIGEAEAVMVNWLEIYYEAEHEDDPVFVSTPNKLDGLIDELTEKYAAQWPVLCEVSIAGSTTTEHMYVGVDGNRGVLFYSSPGVGSFYSKGDETDSAEELTYYYAGHNREFPANAEVPLASVKLAVREFMANCGERPEGVAWQACE